MRPAPGFPSIITSIDLRSDDRGIEKLGVGIFQVGCQVRGFDRAAADHLFHIIRSVFFLETICFQKFVQLVVVQLQELTGGHGFKIFLCQLIGRGIIGSILRTSELVVQDGVNGFGINHGKANPTNAFTGREPRTFNSDLLPGVTPV